MQSTIIDNVQNVTVDGGIAVVARSTFVGSNNWVKLAGGQVISFGDNDVSDASTATSTLSRK